MEGRRITLYLGDANESEHDTSKPGTPGIETIDYVDPDLSSQEFLSPPLHERPASARGEPSREIVKQLTESVIPKLSAVLDQEKVLAACTLIVNQIIVPVIRKRTLYYFTMTFLILVILQIRTSWICWWNLSKFLEV